MTELEIKRKKNREAQAKWRANNREHFNDYHNKYMRERNAEHKALKEFYIKYNSDNIDK